MMASSAPISWFLFFPHHLLKHHINVFMVNVPFPLILLIQKSTALTSKLPLSLKSFAQNLQTWRVSPCALRKWSTYLRISLNTRRVLQFNKLLMFCLSNLRQKVGKRASWCPSPNFSKKSVRNEEVTSMSGLLTFQRWGRLPWRLAGRCTACTDSALAESCSKNNYQLSLLSITIIINNLLMIIIIGGPVHCLHR